MDILFLIVAFSSRIFRFLLNLKFQSRRKYDGKDIFPVNKKALSSLNLKFKTLHNWIRTEATSFRPCGLTFQFSIEASKDLFLPNDIPLEYSNNNWDHFEIAAINSMNFKIIYIFNIWYNWFNAPECPFISCYRYMRTPMLNKCSAPWTKADGTNIAK